MSAMAELRSNVIFKLEAGLYECQVWNSQVLVLMESLCQNESNLAVMIWFDFTAHVPHNLITFHNSF